MNESTIAVIAQMGTQRRAWVKATGNITRQIKAIERRAKDAGLDKEIVDLTTLPLTEALATIKPYRNQIERDMTKAAKSLGLNEFVDSINGFGYLGLALIVSETGDLSNYANPGKVWKRMGLAVFGGKSQRRVKDAAEAVEQGYSPMRRSMMFTIGDSLIKKQNAYRDLYLERKEYERERDPEMSDMHSHRRAQRYMEKRLLRNLWQAWRQCDSEATRRMAPAAVLPQYVTA